MDSSRTDWNNSESITITDGAIFSMDPTFDNQKNEEDEIMISQLTVDENQEISEGPGGPELNNEGVKNVYAESSVDAFVSNMTVDLGDGLAGKECPMVFEVGIANIPQGTTYRLFFNVCDKKFFKI